MFEIEHMKVGTDIGRYKTANDTGPLHLLYHSIKFVEYIKINFSTYWIFFGRFTCV